MKVILADQGEPSAQCWCYGQAASAAIVVTSMTEEDTVWMGLPGQTVGNTPHVSLKLNRGHLSVCAGSFKAQGYLKIAKTNVLILCVHSQPF